MAHAIRSEQARSNVQALMPPMIANPIEDIGFDIGRIGYCVQGFHRERGIKRYLTHEMGFADAKLALEFIKSELPEADLSLSAKGFFSQEVPDFERKADVMTAIVKSAKHESRPGRFILNAVGFNGLEAKSAAREVWVLVWSADQ